MVKLYTFVSGLSTTVFFGIHVYTYSMRKARKTVFVKSSGASMREVAYAHVQRKIAVGELAPGSTLSELPLSRELGISRTPIREAISQLVAEGLLEQTPNRGAVVVQLTRQDIVDLYELREALEVYAVAKAAQASVRSFDLEQLKHYAGEVLVLKEELTRTQAQYLDAKQMHRAITSDLRFHALLMHVGGNTRLLKVVNETRLLIRIFFAMRRPGHAATDLDRIHQQHMEVWKALAERDAERAKLVLSLHIQTSLAERLQEFENWNRETSLSGSLPGLFEPALSAN